MKQQRKQKQKQKHLNQPNCTSKSTIQLKQGNMTMTKRQNEIVRFAISYLMANLDDAFADYDEESEVLTDGFKPTFQELDDIHTELVTQNLNQPNCTSYLCNKSLKGTKMEDYEDDYIEPDVTDEEYAEMMSADMDEEEIYESAIDF